MRAPRAAEPLPAAIRRLFESTPGAGAPPVDAPGWYRGAAGSEAAEARVEVFVRRAMDGRVAELRYRVWGCPHTIATRAWLAGEGPGRTLDDPPAGGPLGWQAALAVPVEKLGRLLVIEDALAACRAAAAAGGAENSVLDHAAATGAGKAEP
jgi:hypothetical protein